MMKAQEPKDPIVLSYLTLRKAVGLVALALPFAVTIPWALRHHAIQASISAYYYTGTRNVFVGSLCAIAMFMLCARGYDSWDETVGIISAICAIGVAFAPTAPATCATHLQRVTGWIHYSFAAVLFTSLAIFCLFLFRMSAQGHTVTRRKRIRNRVYTICGITILLSMILLAVTTLLHPIKFLLPHLAPGIFFETTSLLAFGIAWLVKGEAFLKDESPGHRASKPAGQGM